MGISDVTGINKALKEAGSLGPDDRGIAGLWPPFTSHLVDHLESGGTCALVARLAGGQAQLFVSDAGGRALGGFRDPLGIAAAMVIRGLDRLTLHRLPAGGPGRAGVEAAIRALITVPATGPWPPIDGVVAVPRAGAAASPGPSGPPRIGDDHRVEQARRLIRDSPAGVPRALRLLAEAWPQAHTDVARGAIVRAAMEAANRCTDLRGPWADVNVGHAIDAWSLVTELAPAEEDRVCRTMMDVANRLANAPPELLRPAIEAAIRLWVAVASGASSPDSRGRAVRTMMSTANRLSAVGNPERDVGSAVAVWSAVHRLADGDPEEALRVIKTLMSVANHLTKAELPPEQVDAAGAIACWRASVVLSGDPEHRRRVARTMWMVAESWSGPAATTRQRAAASAVRRAAADLGAGTATGPTTSARVADAAESLLLATSIAEVRRLLGEAPPEGATHLVSACMSRARRANELDHDVPFAAALWSEAARLGPPGEERQHIVAIMMAVAHKRISTEDPTARDVPGAVAIYEAVHALDVDQDQRHRVVKTMMDVANLLTELSQPTTIDMPGAIQLWEAVARTARTGDDLDRVVRTMMDIANKLTDTRVEGLILDVPRALLLWQATWRLDARPDHRDRVKKTMMAMANRLSQEDAPAADLGAAISIWVAVHDLVAPDAPDEALLVVRTMMDVANHHTRLDGPGPMNVGAAAALWLAIADMSDLADDRQRAMRTAWALANRLCSAEASDEDLVRALQLWQVAFQSSDDHGRRAIKSVLDIGEQQPALARRLLHAFRTGVWVDGWRLPVQAGLMYDAHDYEGVLAFVAGLPAPPLDLLALTADARRKLGRYGEALRLTDEVLRAATDEDDPVAADAVVSALSCRGYCLLERLRAGEPVGSDALLAFQQAEQRARASALPVPPRAISGRGYVLRLLGDEAGAQQAFAEALMLDADNRKAWLEA